MLAPEVIDDLGGLEPYPSHVAALGYTHDPIDPVIVAPIPVRQSRDQFRTIVGVEIGVLVPSILVKSYLSNVSAVGAGWQPVDRTAPNSFFAGRLLPPTSRTPPPIGQSFF